MNIFFGGGGGKQGKLIKITFYSVNVIFLMGLQYQYNRNTVASDTN